MSSSNDAAVGETRAAIQDLEQAYVGRDMDRFVGHFTDDIVAMPPGMVPIVGIDDWKALLTGFFAGSNVSDIVTRSEDITVVGDWAIEWHNEAATYTRKDTGEANRMFIKGIWVFRRDDRRWKIARYDWNDRPEFDPDA